MKKILHNLLFQIISFNAVVLIIMNIMILQIMEKHVLDELRLDFEKKVALARPQIDLNALQREDQSELKSFADRMKMLTQLRVTIMNRRGKVLADSDVPSENLKKVENHLSREEIQEALMLGAGIASRKSKTINKELIYYAETIRKKGKIIGFFRTAIFMPEVNAKFSFYRTLLIKIDFIFAVMIFFTIVLIYFRNRRRLSTVRKELIRQRENNIISALPYQDYHEVNRLVREMNKSLTWTENKIEEKQAYSELLKNILNSIGIGVLVFSHGGQIIFSNVTFRKIFGIQETDPSDQGIYKLIHFPPVIGDIENFLSDKTLPEISNTIKFYEESYITYRLVRPNVGKGLEEIYLLTVRDVTRLQQLETIRRDFVANVSHEFKTPLSSIKGYTETLLSGLAEKKDIRQKFLKKIEKQTIQLEHLVSDVLHLAKIEKKDISDRTSIDVRTMLNEIIEEFRPVALRLDSVIEFYSTEGDTEILIEANPEMAHSIVANLLSNALQYNTPKGKVIIRLRTGNSYCVIEIEDTGIGISKEEISRIFERFFRTAEARAAFPEGTGLGLSIVKNALDVLGGQVNVQSVPGKGSIFIVKIPLADKNKM